MLKTFLRLFFIFIILIIALISFLLTPIGLRFSANIASTVTHHQLTYQKISGVLIGPITIDHVKYENKQQTITIEKLHINWNLMYLFGRQLHISSLNVTHLNIIKNEKKPKIGAIKATQKIMGAISTILKNKKLPFHLVIDRADFSDIQINNAIAQTHLQIPKLFLQVQFTKEKWDAQLLVTLLKSSPITLQFQLHGKPKAYTFQLWVNGLQTHWKLIGNGNLQSLTLHAPKNSFLNGSLKTDLKINWVDHFTWQGFLNATKINLSLLNPEWIDALSIHLNSMGYHAKNFITENKLRLQTPAGELHFIAKHNNQWHVLLVLPNQTIQFAMDDHFQHKQWHGTLHQLSVAMKNTDTWHLEKEVHITASSKFIDMTSLCLKAQKTGYICMQGQWSAKHILMSAQAHIHHFAWLHPYLYDVHIPQGQLVASIKINGDINQPNIIGKLNLNRGNIILPRINIMLSNVSASIMGNGRTLNIKAQAFSEQQPILLQGSIDLFQPDFLAKISLTTNNVLVVNTEEYLAYVTSDLMATIKNKSITLNGTITIPIGKVQPHDYKPTIKLPMNDIVYVGKITHPPKSFWEMHTNILVNLGKNVHLKASGVNVQLGGSLYLSQQPHQEVFGTGKIFARHGTYFLYGQTLTILHDAYLSFTHSELDNPTLNLKATKVIPSVDNVGISDFSQGQLIVGVEIHGTLKKPKIKFFSNRESLSQANILSYLLLGYGNNTNTPGNTDFLLRALSAVNITSQGLLGKENIATQIESGLGLSELGVESETTLDTLGNPLDNQSSFVVGKHLTKNLYARYSFGLLDTVNVFQLRYLLSQSWAVQADTSALGDGADLLYTIERN